MVVGQAADWVERYSAAAAGLVVAASFWSVVHPPSYHLLRCIAAALPVWAGYAETARACASGRVPDGPPVRTNSLSPYIFTFLCCPGPNQIVPTTICPMSYMVMSHMLAKQQAWLLAGW